MYSPPSIVRHVAALKYIPSYIESQKELS